jgi:hypothetical protein
MYEISIDLKQDTPDSLRVELMFSWLLRHNVCFYSCANLVLMFKWPGVLTEASHPSNFHVNRAVTLPRGKAWVPLDAAMGLGQPSWQVEILNIAHDSLFGRSAPKSLCETTAVPSQEPSPTSMSCEARAGGMSIGCRSSWHLY